MVKKIAIISNYDLQNYGNRLQNYAVHKIFQSLGYETASLNSSDNIFVPHVLFGKKALLKHGLNFFLSKDKYVQDLISVGYANRLNHFYQFEKMFEHIDVRNSDWSGFDYYALGSDQILHPFYVENMKSLSIKNLPKDILSKAIMISPSFGVSELGKSSYSEYQFFLENVRGLSVREKSGAEIIRKISGKNVDIHIDPTMMLSEKQWLKVSKKMPFKKPYILKFFLGDESTETQEYINGIAVKEKFEIHKLLDQNDYRTYYAGPSEFLWLIKNAELVCTDSFHGSVFSILFHKPFVVFSRLGSGNNMGSRIETLLSTFGLNDRLYMGSSHDWKKTDYEKSDSILIEKKKEFMDYICKNID